MASISVCISCMGNDELLDLFHSYMYECEEEIYADIFESCFNIHISREAGLSYVCVHCVQKLRDAAGFRQQTLTSNTILMSSKDLIQQLDPPVVVGCVLKDKCLEDSASEQDTTLHIPTARKESVLNKTAAIHMRTDTAIRQVVIAKQSGSAKTRKRTRANVQENPSKTFADHAPYTLELGQLRCHLCGEQFQKTMCLEAHMNMHYPHHMCTACGKGFASKQRLKKHSRSHSQGPFLCKICGLEFMKINSLLSHGWIKHRQESMFPCQHCGERFRTYTRRTNHLRDVHGQTHLNFQCPICNKKFLMSGQKTKHMRMHHAKPKNHTCGLCDLRFGRIGQLRSHLANAHQIGEKLFECPFCQRRYSRKDTLHQHMRIHSDDKPFHCESCDMRFVQKCSLKSHMLTHERRGEAPLVVGDCAAQLAIQDHMYCLPQ